LIEGQAKLPGSSGLAFAISTAFTQNDTTRLQEAIERRLLFG
jgi:hypothetical protein